MKHLGDITKIRGDLIEIVDVVTGGSPCQDLSVANGKRTGLDGARSGLFMEQIRIIKEMREHDRNNGRTGEFVRPRYMVWENVPGALSSNGGEDFRIVLEEAAKIADNDAVIPRFEGGAWKQSGCVMADGWSVAWRVHDAQFWGVPQRRKRIALVADFNGLSAPEILFERKGLSWDSESRGETWEETSGNSETGVNGAIYFKGCGERNGIERDVVIASSWDGTQTAPTLTMKNAGGDQRMPDKQNFNAVISYGLDRASYNQGKNAKYNFSVDKERIGAQTAKGPGAVFHSLGVRRLTPIECERLQGFPDGWTDIGDWTDSNGKVHKGDSDTPRYKALGNSIALPFWFYLLRRISAQYERPATLGSLFDGISGFPLCWERCNGIGTARWSSEIEEFPIAVAKKHFGDEEAGVQGDIREWI